MKRLFVSQHVLVTSAKIGLIEPVEYFCSPLLVIRTSISFKIWDWWDVLILLLMTGVQGSNLCAIRWKLREGNSVLASAVLISYYFIVTVPSVTSKNLKVPVALDYSFYLLENTFWSLSFIGNIGGR